MRCQCCPSEVQHRKPAGQQVESAAAACNVVSRLLGLYITLSRQQTCTCPGCMGCCVKASHCAYDTRKTADMQSTRRQGAMPRAKQDSASNPHLDDEEARPAVAANETQAPEAAAVPPHDHHAAADALNVDRAVGHRLVTRDMLARHLNVHQALFLWVQGMGRVKARASCEQQSSNKGHPVKPAQVVPF